MEELLNKRIDEWWKPRWFGKVYNFWIENWHTVLNTKKANYISFATRCVFREDYGEEQEMDYVSYTYRELVSKESWLIQWLMNKEKINQDELENVAMGWFDDESPVYSTPLWTDRLIMILSVEDNPMEVLVSLLK